MKARHVCHESRGYCWARSCVPDCLRTGQVDSQNELFRLARSARSSLLRILAVVRTVRISLPEVRQIITATCVNPEGEERMLRERENGVPQASTPRLAVWIVVAQTRGPFQAIDTRIALRTSTEHCAEQFRVHHKSLKSYLVRTPTRLEITANRIASRFAAIFYQTSRASLTTHSYFIFWNPAATSYVWFWCITSSSENTEFCLRGRCRDEMKQSIIIAIRTDPVPSEMDRTPIHRTALCPPCIHSQQLSSSLASARDLRC